ncbi:MAG: TonB-dependent receptor [Bacteroidales bacterium]|nr:TonB-dependent receptor [Bacteroidales bacterium]
MKSVFYRMLCLFLLFTCTVQAQQTKNDANINGHVTDARTEEHLPYVSITLRGTTIGVTTDATGHYFLKGMPLGEYLLAASCVGYRTVEQKVSIEANKTVEVNFVLEEEAISIHEVVVSATRNETDKKEAATIVNVMSAKLFEAISSHSLSESMSFQPGLRVENNCGNCGTTQLRINGLEGQYSQILIDSRPVFSSLAAVYGLEQLPVAMIERVEVVRGGGSALFGSSAIGGVVNIITKDPLRNSISLSNTSNFLTDGTPDFNTSINGSFVSDDHKAGVYLFGMIRDRRQYDHNDDDFSDVPRLNSETSGFRGYYRTGNYSRLTAEYHHIHEARRGGNNFDLPPHEADIAEYLNHKIDGGGLRYDFFSPGYKHRAGVYASAQNIRRDSYFAAEKHTGNYGNTADKTFVAGAQYTRAFDRMWFLPAELTAGTEYSYNTLRDVYTALNRSLSQTTHIAGVFLQNEWKNERFGVLAGVRLDKHSLMSKPTLSPRATLRYSPVEKAGFRASYSSGYRAPQAYNEDLHIEAVGGTLALIRLADGLRPEYSHSFSASADLYHDFGKVQTNLLAEGFVTTLNDVFTIEKAGEDAQGNLIHVRRNGAGATVKGVNMEAKAGLPGIFEIQAGYTLQQSRYKQPERWSDALPPQRKMFRAPDSYGYFTSSFSMPHGFKASVFGNYTGTMLVKHTRDGVDTEQDTPAFFDAGFKLSRRIRLSGLASLEISGGVKNVFNAFQQDLDYGRLKDAAYVYGPSLPRLFFAGMKFEM